MRKISEEVCKYAKKPVVIEAIQLSQYNTVEVLTFCNNNELLQVMKTVLSLLKH